MTGGRLTMRHESDDSGPLIVDPPCFFDHRPVRGARLRADVSAWFPGEDDTGEVCLAVPPRMPGVLRSAMTDICHAGPRPRYRSLPTSTHQVRREAMHSCVPQRFVARQTVTGSLKGKP